MSAVAKVSGKRPKAAVQVTSPEGSATVASRWVGGYIWTGIETCFPPGADFKTSPMKEMIARAKGLTQVALLRDPEVAEAIRAIDGEARNGR